MKANSDLSNAKLIALPEVWSFHHGSKTIRMGHLAESASVKPCTATEVNQENLKTKNWLVKLYDREIRLLTKKPKGEYSENLDALLTPESIIEAGVIVPGAKAMWLKHSAKLQGDGNQINAFARQSWKEGLNFNTEVRDDQGNLLKAGLRPAQGGALHAITAHWTVSNKPALIVMPTGTGKTEVMLACMIMSRPDRLLVLVPSNALRTQTFEKFCKLGVLRKINAVKADIVNPVTGMLKGSPSTDELEQLKTCNVIVTTVAAIQSLSNADLLAFLNLFDHVYFDEAHHLPSYSWNRISEMTKSKKVLQFTATPFRLDGQRIPGRIIYNFPLHLAQEQGYFRKIRFIDAFEPDPDGGDAKIAAVAVEQLEKDIADGFNHIVLARADTVARAESLYENYYQKHTALNPVVIYSQARGARQIIKDIKAGKHKIVVCVDMFGEGFDLPNLKIAALHDPHKSLAISLQFTGRFTRDATGIGDPTVVANTADPRVSDAIEELYAEDADWNKLIPDLSAKAIQSQMDFSDFLERMDNKIDLGEDVFGLNVLQPKISTVIYKAKSFNPTKYRAWTGKSHVEREWVSKDKDLVIFITRNRTPIDWASIKDTTDETWNLFILAYEADQKLLYIHSSQKGSLYPDLAEAVTGEKANLLHGEDMFRAFHGLTRLIFHNAGLYNKGSKLRFRMFTGLDVTEIINPSEQTNSTKSNLFGIGREDGDAVSIGVSYKGRVWSMSSGSVPDWRAWCRKIGAKILDSKIPTDDYLKHTLRPKEIKELPRKEILLVSLPAEWFGEDAEQLRLFWGTEEKNPDAFEIKATTPKSQTTLEMHVGWDDATTATFNLTWGQMEGEFCVTQMTGTKIDIKIGKKIESLAQYFTEQAPTVCFLDGSEVHGGYMLESPSELAPLFDKNEIVALDWSAANIVKESKWKAGQMRADSVQATLIEQLRKNRNQIIFDDDDSGEAADVVEIIEDKDVVTFKLYHCKYSGGSEPGTRVKDPAEVCMQAARSIRWLVNYRRLIAHLIRREKLLNGRPTRLEKGTAKNLSSLRRRLRKLRCKAEIYIVQPGISKSACDAQICTMLGAASNLIQDMTGKPMKVIGSL